MARRIGYIRLLLALYLAALILSPSPAAAADPLPGDACTAAENAVNTFQWNPTGDNGTPAAAGVTNAIFCIGSVRKSIMNFQAATGYVGIGNTAPGSMLDVGKAGTTLGTLRLEGDTSGYVQIQPSTAAGSWTMTLPTGNPASNGYVLSSTTAGVTSWISNAGTASTALSSITAAAAGHTIANAANAQVWNWDTLTTGTALTLGSTSMTTGSLLRLSNTNATGAGDTLYASNASTTDGAEGIEGYASGATGNVTGVYGHVVSTSANATGVAGIATGATGASFGVYGQDASTTGVGGYFTETGASGATYGVYGTDASATGYGGYFTNTNGGYALATGAGNVGIGTTTPDAILSVKSAGQNAVVNIYGVTSGTDYGVVQVSSTGALTNAANRPLVLQPNAGSVGIGTTTPGNNLEVSGANNTSLRIDTSAASTLGPSLQLGNAQAGAHTYYIYADGSGNGPGAGVLEFYDATAPATRMVILSGGNVGIGTTNPAQKLEVNGQVKVDTFAAASATTVCQNANVLSTCSSSIRYKEKVKDAPFGLKDVMLMRPVTFKWKGRDEKDLGFIAEEMEKVNPLFVNYERGQIEGVKYPQLTAVLASAIKEQQAEIEELRAEIAALKERPAKH